MLNVGFSCSSEINNFFFIYQIKSNIESQRNVDKWNLGRENVRLDPTSNVIAGGFGKLYSSRY